MYKYLYLHIYAILDLNGPHVFAVFYTNRYNQLGHFLIIQKHVGKISGETCLEIWCTPILQDANSIVLFLWVASNSGGTLWMSHLQKALFSTTLLSLCTLKLVASFRVSVH